MKRKLLALSLGLMISLSSASALAMSAQEAKNLADTYVPADARYSILMNDKKDLIFYYHSDTDNYKVKFDKKNEFIRALYIEKIISPKSTSVKLSDIDAMNILEVTYPDAKLTRITRFNEPEQTFYNLEFTFDGGTGDMNILAADGTIMDTTLLYDK